MSPSTISTFSEIFGLKINYELAEKLVESFAKNIESGNFIPDVKIPQWKIPIPGQFFAGGRSAKEHKKCYLFDRKKDFNFQNNLAGNQEAVELENKMIAKLIEVLKEERCPPEQFKRLMLKEL